MITVFCVQVKIQLYPFTTVVVVVVLIHNKNVGVNWVRKDVNLSRHVIDTVTNLLNTTFVVFYSDVEAKYDNMYKNLTFETLTRTIWFTILKLSDFWEAKSLL